MTLSIVFYIISFVWIISEIVLSKLKKSNPENPINDYDKSTFRIIWITVLLSLVIGIFVSTYSFGRISILPYQQIIGLILISLGLLIRWSAILKLKESFTVDISVKKDQKIIKDGVYKFVRHPSYTGSLLSFFGLSLMFTNVFTIIIITIPIMISFLHRINIEEKVLTQVIGTDYIEYSIRTKKLIPFIY
jgi:protein-S-isoprenylcysteine O-methyltransferase Ste14